MFPKLKIIYYDQLRFQLTFVIRQLKLSDNDRWLKLWSGYNEFYGRSIPSALPDDVIEATLKAFFEEDVPMYGLVPEADGELHGFSHYIYHRSTMSNYPSCYLQDLFTDHVALANGVSTKLINGVFKQARLVGATHVYWQTHETNVIAQQLYN